MVEKHNLTFPVIYGLDVQKEADKIGGYFDSEHGYFQPANFILRDSKVFNATYFSGPLGRLQAQLVLEVVSKMVLWQREEKKEALRGKEVEGN